MNVRQLRAMALATEITHDEVRARAVMLVAANNRHGLLELENFAAKDDGVKYMDWRRLVAVVDTLGDSFNDT
jgi:hypothetical protein